MKKQFIAKLLVLGLALAMLPTAAFAARRVNSPTNPNNNYYWDEQNNTYYYYVEDTAPAPVDTTDRVNDPIDEDGVIDAKVVAGTAKVALSEKAVESLADLAEGNEIVLEINSEGANRVEVSFSAEALAAVAAETGADLTIKTEVATIKIPNEALSSELGTGTLRVSVQAYTYSVGFTIQASGKALKNIKGLTVTF